MFVPWIVLMWLPILKDLLIRSKIFSLKATLSILYINPNNSHIRFGRCFDYLRSKDKNNIIEDICELNDFLNNVKCNGVLESSQM